jgi:hypothetical protein
MNTDKKTDRSKQPQPSGHELSEQELYCVTGGRVGGGPIMLNPQPLPP